MKIGLPNFFTLLTLTSPQSLFSYKIQLGFYFPRKEMHEKKLIIKENTGFYISKVKPGEHEQIHHARHNIVLGHFVSIHQDQDQDHLVTVL